jgi:hypothetical protein
LAMLRKRCINFLVATKELLLQIKMLNSLLTSHRLLPIK